MGSWHLPVERGRAGGVRLAAWVAVAALALAALERGGRILMARYGQPTRGAEWIWAKGTNGKRPAAFYLLRDFELAHLPEVARLLIVADEEYVLYVNGTRVGSNGYTQGAPQDAYRVEGLLVQGGNRLAVEVRSGRGTGGFLAALYLDDDPGPFLVSDRTWRIVRQDHPGILSGWFPAEDGEAAWSWAHPPAGRWRAAELPATRPLYAALRLPGRPVPARSRRVLEPLAWRASRSASAAPRQPSPILLDWGEEVVGYPVLEMDESGPQLGLVYLGQDPPNPLGRPADAVLVTLPHGTVWADAVPRRFRYLMVMATTGVARAHLDPVDETAAQTLLPKGEAAGGVFGLPPPASRTAVEYEVWRELQGLPGLAGREKL